MAHTRPSAPETTANYSIQVGVRGRVVLPAPLRESLGLKEGDRMLLTVEGDGTLRLRSLRQELKKLRGVYREAARGRSVVDELIRDRREEARRENER